MCFWTGWPKDDDLYTHIIASYLLEVNDNNDSVVLAMYTPALMVTDHPLLPDRHRTVYSLRTRRHDSTLSANTDRRNFIYRLLLTISFKPFSKSSLLLLLLLRLFYHFSFWIVWYLLRFVSGKLNEYVMLWQNISLHLCPTMVNSNCIILVFPVSSLRYCVLVLNCSTSGLRFLLFLIDRLIIRLLSIFKVTQPVTSTLGFVQPACFRM